MEDSSGVPGTHRGGGRASDDIRQALKELSEEFPDRKLKLVCSDEHLARISLSITEWRTLAPFLGLTEPEEEAIARDYPNMATQRIAMLRKWRGKRGSRATYKKLCKIFLELERQDLVEVVCRLLRGGSSESSSDEDAGAGTLASSTAIATYAFYLKNDVYLRQKFPTYGKWPPNFAKRFINLALITKQSMHKDEMDRFTKQTIRGHIDDIVHEKQSLSMEEIAKAEGNTLPHCILVEGAPGVGKSTFAWKLCRKWSKGKLLQQYRLVVLLRLRDKRVREAKTVSDLFYYFNRPIQQMVVEKIQATGGRGVLLLFEGYDELPAKLRTSGSIFLEVIKGQELPLATVLVTSRPSASGPLYMECRSYISQHVEILGFTHENIDSYLESTMGQDTSLLQGLQQYLTYYPHIRSMLYIPLNCAVVAEVYRVNKRDKSLIPKTWTDLYSSLLRCLLCRYLDDHPIHQRKSWKSNKFRDLPTDVYRQLCELGRIAYEGILQDQQVIFSDLHGDFSSLGLMQCVPELYVEGTAAESFNFLHLTLQEYMAALHLSEQPVVKQTEVFRKYGQSLPSHFELMLPRDRDDRSSHFQIVLRFLAGLTKFTGYSSSSIKSLLSYNKRPSHANSSTLQISLDGLHSIFEAQDTSNVCEAVGASVVAVSLLVTTVTSFDCFVLGYCVSHTNCPWEIDLSGCGIGDEGMEMFIRGAVEGGAKRSGYVSVMTIGSNKITGVGLNQLLEMPELLKLRELDLSHSTLGRGGAVTLLKSPLLDKLEELTLDETGIGVEDCHTLSELLSSSPTLQKISISNNHLSPEAVELIITGLKHHTVLEELNMSGSQFSLQNCISLASATQPPTELNLADCHINEEGAIELAKLIDHITVTSLHLEGNPIGVRGAITIAGKLLQNTSLRALDLRHESIGPEGTLTLIDSLSQNSTLKILRLPWEYLSSVETSEVYRRVKDRIKWGPRSLPRPPLCHWTEVTIGPPPLPLEEGVLLSDPTHQPHPPRFSYLPESPMMGLPRVALTESVLVANSADPQASSKPQVGMGVATNIPHPAPLPSGLEPDSGSDIEPPSKRPRLSAVDLTND